MSIFCYKKIDAAIRLGDQLKQKRESLGLRLEQVADKTRIPLKYLEAIERNDYHVLPKAKAHRLAYIKEYASQVGLSPAVCASQLHCEDGLDDSPTIHPYQAIRLFPFASISIFVRNTLMAGSAALFAFYLIWQVKGVLEPPKLVLYSPQEGVVYDKPEATITGETQKETKLTVNGKEIVVNEQGKFEAKVGLSTGLNTITIEAIKKHGKTTTIVRHLVVKQNVTEDLISLK